MEFKYEPPRAFIWKSSDLDKIEAKMTYGSSSWPSHGDGSQYSPIKMNMGSSHRGSAAKCWLTFDTHGSYDIECSVQGGYIFIYDSFRNAPSTRFKQAMELVLDRSDAMEKSPVLSLLSRKVGWLSTIIFLLLSTWIRTILTKMLVEPIGFPNLLCIVPIPALPHCELFICRVLALTRFTV